MTKDKAVTESKNYLISVHDALRRAFSNALPTERAVIDNILRGIEKEVEQLETLEEVMKVQKKLKEKKEDMVEEQ